MPLERKDVEAYVDATLKMIELEIDPNWREAVITNLMVNGKAAADVAAFKLPDDIMPAPGFDPDG